MENNNNEIAVYSGQVEGNQEHGAMIDLALSREPAIVLEEARRAAHALGDVISKKAKPVKFNGEQYLEFEDWQTVGRFYGITAKIRETRYCEYGATQGFEAIADAIQVSTDKAISTAEAMCLDNEKNWQGKPLFQLRSMAQTRAMAKALRNVLGWVVVLAGYRPTPAEEMHRDEEGQQSQSRPAFQPPQRKSDVITEAQSKRLWAIGRGRGLPDDDIKARLIAHGFHSTAEVTKDKYEMICAEFQSV